MSSFARRNCPNKDKNVPVHACSRCKQDFYCSRDCQKKSWGTHKHRCISVDTAKQTISELTIDAIRTAIANANPGDVIVLEKGTYEGSGSLRINKPIILLGAGKDSTKLCCDGLSIQREDATENQQSESITVADLEVTNSSNIENNNYTAVNLCGIRFSCPIGTRDDAISTGRQDGEILFLECEINGGSDGLCIFGKGVHLSALPFDTLHAVVSSQEKCSSLKMLYYYQSLRWVRNLGHGRLE